ncbi:hypothetical protein SLS62_005061 [Diatrype stigma]|uniref:Phosphoribulokinase/uridine kinase domain-containing protein n=1 Tax=Diatrype stigma TaxID=117547 RepID=A0AAN9UTE4_9PEZI
MESTHRALAERILNLSKKNQCQQKQRDHQPSTAPPPAPPGSDHPARPPRILIALAGPPGSGKTTIAANVALALAGLPDPPKTVVISVDGFHLPLAALRNLPNAAEALARRGAPWTFDAQAAVEMVRKLRRSRADQRSGGGNGGGEEAVLVPTFDHAVKDPVAGGLVVDPDVQVCLLEGNYLLCDEGPWAEIAGLVDERWLVRVEEGLARKRIAARHLAAGIEPTMELALARTDYNDIPNGRYVMERSLGRQDVLIESVENK